MAQTKVKLISNGVITVDNLHASHGITTDHIGEGSNQFFTDARVQSYLTTNNYITTTDVASLETVTSLSLSASTLSYINESGTTTNIDLSSLGYLTSFTETDPVFSASVAAGITSTNITNWNTAYGWGDHSTQSYATETYVNTAVANLVDTAPTTLDTLNELAAALGDDPNFATTVSTSIGTKWTQDNTKISNWDTAYGWGNHASAGYAAASSLSSYLPLTGGTISGVINLNDSGYLKGSPTYGFRFNNSVDSINALIVDNSGNSIAYSSHRAPIFYDSNNTGYYLDPASTSNLYDLTLTGAKHTYLYINPGNGYESMVRYNGGSGNTWYVGKRTTSQLVGTESFHFYSQAAGQTVGGIDTSGNIISIGSSRAPIFYDSNDTNSYFDKDGIVLRGASPTVYFRDTNHNSAMLHCNSNLLYVLRGANDTTSWTQVGGQWPGYWNLTNNAYIGGGSASFVGDVTANTSDERLKENVKPIENALEKVKSINGVTFDWKDNLEEINYTRLKIHDVGVIAQEVQKVLPEIVVPAPFDTDEDGNSRSGDNYLTVQYEKIVPLLIEAIKEQQQQIEELKQLINK